MGAEKPRPNFSHFNTQATVSLRLVNCRLPNGHYLNGVFRLLQIEQSINIILRLVLSQRLLFGLYLLDQVLQQILTIVRTSVTRPTRQPVA